MGNCCIETEVEPINQQPVNERKLAEERKNARLLHLDRQVVIIERKDADGRYRFFEDDRWDWFVNQWPIIREKYDRAEGEINRAMMAGIREILRRRNFIRRANYQSRMLHYPPENKLRVYKVARIMKGWDLLHDAVVIVGLNVFPEYSRIFDSATGKETHLRGLNSRNKYMTDYAQVDSYKVVAKFDEIGSITQKLIDGRCHVVSNFDPKFCYRLGEAIREKSCGEKGVGCYQGMHFFLNEQESTKYAKSVWGAIPSLPRIGKPVNDDQGQEVIPIETEDSVIPQMIRKDTVALAKFFKSQRRVNVNNVCRLLFGEWYLKNNNFSMNQGYFRNNEKLETSFNTPTVKPPPRGTQVIMPAVKPSLQDN